MMDVEQCGPCRGFTPALVAKYEEMVKAGHEFEVIFVSVDESEEEALDYFDRMPWKMIDFNNRDVQSQLVEKFKVRTIPTLVLLDGSGNLITTEGREVVFEYEFTEWVSYAAENAEKERRFKAEVNDVQNHFRPVTFFNNHKVVDKEGNVVSGDSFAGKVVGLYFSAHWCPPCREFTPKLAKKYNAFITNGDAFEIVFVSMDRGAAEYFAEMPWKRLDVDDHVGKNILVRAFEISGIPTFVLADDSGIITDEGGEVIMSVDSTAEIATWKEDKAAEEARLAVEIANMPEEVTIPLHEHPLKKVPTTYLGKYGCDACGGGGKGWVFHCDGCGFDVHPACVLKALTTP